jgi:hypothetical protein
LPSGLTTDDLHWEGYGWKHASSGVLGAYLVSKETILIFLQNEAVAAGDVVPCTVDSHDSARSPMPLSERLSRGLVLSARVDNVRRATPQFRRADEPFNHTLNVSRSSQDVTALILLPSPRLP